MKRNLQTLIILGLGSVLILSMAFVALEIVMSPVSSHAQNEPTPNPFQSTHGDLVATSQSNAANSPGVVEEMPYPGQPDFKGGSGASANAIVPNSTNNTVLQASWLIIKTSWKSLTNLFKF